MQNVYDSGYLSSQDISVHAKKNKNTRLILVSSVHLNENIIHLSKRK